MLSLRSNSLKKRLAVLALLALSALLLSACDVIVPTESSFDNSANFQLYLCDMLTALRTIFLVMGIFFATIGVSGYALKQLAPQFFAQMLGNIETQLVKIIQGGLILGFAPAAILTFFTSFPGASGLTCG